MVGKDEGCCPPYLSVTLEESHVPPNSPFAHAITPCHFPPKMEDRLSTEMMRSPIAFVPGAPEPRNKGRKPHKLTCEACA